MTHPIDALYNEYLGGDLPPHPTPAPMPAPVRELVEAAENCHRECLSDDFRRMYNAIDAVRAHYGEKP